MNKVIYLDYAATTPAEASVVQAMSECLAMDGVFGNSASRSHKFGWQAESEVENARNNIAHFIGANNREIVWTSGATESNNLALKGVMQKHKSGHLITSLIEHKSILDVCEWLQNQGYEITYLKPDSKGVISPEQVSDAIRVDTKLVSLMLVNNELGSYNDIQAISKKLQGKDIVLHTDAAQAAGKFSLDIGVLGVDLMSLSAHKMYGPKGIGALYVSKKNGLKLISQVHGGGHEQGMRSGTLATHQIVGFSQASLYVKKNMDIKLIEMLEFKTLLWKGLNSIGGVYVNGDLDNASVAHLNVSFDGVEGEVLLASLAKVAVSSGSACNSESVEPSYVLTQIGVEKSLAHASIRFSFGYFTTKNDIDNTISEFQRIVPMLRELT
jgi:cysteine desulfurase